jgi:phage terminase large subunit
MTTVTIPTAEVFRPLLEPSRYKGAWGASIAWIEEAQTLSQRSLTLLRPTIRDEGSEIWASWNPRRKVDAIDDFLRSKASANAIVVQASWR